MYVKYFRREVEMSNYYPVLIFVISTFIIKIASGFQFENCECGRAPRSGMTMRIVGGKRVTPHTLPWLVALMIDGNMHCGSSLLSNRHLLSAGHCVKWTDPATIMAYVGLDDVQNMDGVQKRKIVKAVIHELFTSTKVRDENDIAILTMAYPIVFNDYAVPICLPEAGQDFTGYMAIIAGWGRLGEKDDASRYLMKTTQKILPQADCLQTKLSTHLKPTMMCAYFKGRDGCQGDSGGPLMIIQPNGKYTQPGITSWGIGCADPQYPGVYTRVSHYIDWIMPLIFDSTICMN